MPFILRERAVFALLRRAELSSWLRLPVVAQLTLKDFTIPWAECGLPSFASD
jgi:hypothetical protein